MWRGVCVVCEVYVCPVCIYVYVLVACVLYVWRGVCLCVLHECVAHAAGMYAYVYVVMCVVCVWGGLVCVWCVHMCEHMLWHVWPGGCSMCVDWCLCRWRGVHVRCACSPVCARCGEQGPCGKRFQQAHGWAQSG